MGLHDHSELLGHPTWLKYLGVPRPSVEDNPGADAGKETPAARNGRAKNLGHGADGPRVVTQVDLTHPRDASGGTFLLKKI